MRRKLLILGGTSEARELAAALDGSAHWKTITSLAGVTSQPSLPDGEVRRGGFGGADGLRRYLSEAGIAAVIDASHPFATTITRHAVTASGRAGVPRITLQRRAWTKMPGDNWHVVSDIGEAAFVLPRYGRRVLVTSGHAGLDILAAGRGVELVVRTIKPPCDLPSNAVWIGARGPFTLPGELALMRERRIDVLLSKASGGEATYAKIAAARELGIAVVMLRRPPIAEGEAVDSVAAIVEWLQRLA